MRRSNVVLLLVMLLLATGVSIGASMVVARAVAPVFSTGGSAPDLAFGVLGGRAQPVAVPEPERDPAPVITIVIQPGAGVERDILKAVYRKVNPSVVKIYNLGNTGGPDSIAVPRSQGSGFVWDVQGHIVTEHHVVQGADRIQVAFADGLEAEATLVGSDLQGDISVLKVRVNPQRLVPVELAEMSQVAVGDRAIAIGNPFGFQGSMTVGIISGLGRSIPAVSGYQIPQAIQTDAAINPGNSGGPLVNSRGQVIGINDEVQLNNGNSSGVGFAVPISIASRIVAGIIERGQYQHAYLGINGGTYNAGWTAALGLPADVHGAYVLGVVPGGPADQAGLRAGVEKTAVQLGPDSSGAAAFLMKGGDLITAVDGQNVAGMDDLLVYLEERTSPGQVLNLTVIRGDGSQRTLPVRLGVRPSQTSEPS